MNRQELVQNVKYQQHKKFNRIEMETCNSCTRNCNWCLFGQNKEFQNRSFEILETGYIENLLMELSEHKFSGILSLYSLNEPLMDERIANGFLIDLCRKTIDNKAILHITTNGDLLTEDNLLTMLRAGLNSINISCYDDMIYSKATEYFNKFQNDIAIQMFDYRGPNAVQLKYNRAGSLKGRGTSDKKYSFCFLPLYAPVIGYNGEVRLCCHNPTSDIKIGNIKNEKLFDVLNSKKMRNLRKTILTARENIYPCNVCNFEGLIHT